MDMVEKVAMAGAIATDCSLMLNGKRVLCDDPRLPPERSTQTCICREFARAAIAAMREPTEGMVAAAGEAYQQSVGPLRYEESWRAMIDAALTSSEPQAPSSE